MSLKNRLLREEKVGMGWGGFKAIISSASGYASWISLAMQSVVLYTVLTPYMQTRDIEIPFWCFALMLVALAITVMLFEWKVTIPSAMKFTNSQQYKHDNPIRHDIERLQKDMDKIKEKLGVN